MGGTNNVWRHADLAPEIADDIADEILDFYAKAVSQAESSQMDQLGYVPMILINSVPPLERSKFIVPIVIGQLMLLINGCKTGLQI